MDGLGYCDRNSGWLCMQTRIHISISHMEKTKAIDTGRMSYSHTQVRYVLSYQRQSDIRSSNLTCNPLVESPFVPTFQPIWFRVPKVKHGRERAG